MKRLLSILALVFLLVLDGFAQGNPNPPVTASRYGQTLIRLNTIQAMRDYLSITNGGGGGGGGIVSNAYALTWNLDTRYTNTTDKTVFISEVFHLLSVVGGQLAQVSLYVDANRDGTYDSTANRVLNEGEASSAPKDGYIASWVPSGGIFLFTNLTSGGGSTASVVNGSGIAAYFSTNSTGGSGGVDAPTVAAIISTNNAGSSTISSNSGNYFQDNALRTFRTFAAARAANSNAQFTVTIFSDSYGAQYAWTTNVYRTMKQLYGDAGIGFIYARNGAYNEQMVGLSSPGNVTPNDDANRPLFSFVLLTNSTAALQWTGLNFKTANFYYMRTTNGGTFAIYTNGVLYATVSGNSATTNFMAVTNIIHPLQTTCSLSISNLTSTNYFLGAQLNTTNAGIRFFNHSHSSAASWSLATNNILGFTYALETVLSNELPNLIFVDMSRNDILNGGASGVAGLATNLYTIYTRAKSVQPLQEFLFVASPWMSNDLNAATSDQAGAVIRSFAISNNVGYLDLLSKLPTLTNSAFPYSSTHVDMYHPNYGLYQAYANEVTRFFTGMEWQHALRASRPVWSYEVNYKAHYFDTGFVPLDHNTLTPKSIRNGAYAESGASAIIIVSVPTGLGFQGLATTFDLEGAPGATNMFFRIQTAAGNYANEPSVNTTFGGVTNLMWKSVTVTNYFDGADEGSRQLYIRFLRDDGGANLTNRLYVNRIRLNSIP